MTAPLLIDKDMKKKDLCEKAGISPASVTDIYSIGPKCSAALGELGVSPVIEAAVNTYEGLVNCVLRKE